MCHQDTGQGTLPWRQPRGCHLMRVTPAANVRGCGLPSSWCPSLGPDRHAVLCCAGQAADQGPSEPVRPALQLWLQRQDLHAESPCHLPPPHSRTGARCTVQVHSRRRMGRPFMPVRACTLAGLAPASAPPAGGSPAAPAPRPAAGAPPAAVSSSLPSEAAWGRPPGSEVLAALPPAPAVPVALEAGGSLASRAPSAAAGGALRLRVPCRPAGASAGPGAALGAAGCWLVRAAVGGRGAPWAPVLWPRACPPFAGGACSAFTARAGPAFAAGARPCLAAGAAPGAAEAPAGAAPGGASPAAGLLRVEGTWCRACTGRQGTSQPMCNRCHMDAPWQVSSQPARALHKRVQHVDAGQLGKLAYKGAKHEFTDP